MAARWLYRTGTTLHTDALAADVCASIKRRGDRFESDEELVDGSPRIGCASIPVLGSTALRDLEHSGRIKRDVVEHSWANEPVGGWYLEPANVSA